MADYKNLKVPVETHERLTELRDAQPAGITFGRLLDSLMNDAELVDPDVGFTDDDRHLLESVHEGIDDLPRRTADRTAEELSNGR
jgi:hypothetical protein